MKKITILIFSLMILSEVTAGSPSYKYGAGIILGEPTGISLKMWQSKSRALDAGIGWSVGKNSHLNLHADYLIHKYRLINGEGTNFPVYYGIGARIKLEDDSKFGIRFPLGISYIFESAPFDTFFELVPIFNLVPETSFDLGFGIGIRYNF